MITSAQAVIARFELDELRPRIDGTALRQAAARAQYRAEQIEAGHDYQTQVAMETNELLVEMV